MRAITLNNKWQALKNNTRFFVITGGRGSSKSFAVNSFCAMLSYGVGHKILFTRYTLTSAHLSIIPEFTEKIDLIGRADDFQVNKTEVLNKESGVEILFRGIKTASGTQTANLKSLQGITTWVIDEAEELPDEDVFDKIALSIRKKGIQNRIILILNPATKEHWVYKRFFEQEGIESGFNGVKGNTTYIHTTYLDNIQNLDQSFIDDTERMKERNPKRYQHVIMGGWLNTMEGVIFENWTIGEFKQVGVSVFGQDFGFSIDPTTLVECSVDKSRKIIYIREHFYLPKLQTSQIGELNKRYAGEHLIYADSAEPRLISELKKYCNIREAKKGQGSITAGIALLQDYDLVIDPNSTNLIRELNNYVWEDKKSKTPVDAYNHLIDGIRYAIFSSLTKKQMKVS